MKASAAPGTIPYWAAGVAAVCLLKASVAMAALGSGRLPIDVNRIVFCAHIIAFTAAGLVLVSFGRRDQRAVSLGVFFLVVGTAFSDALLNALALEWHGNALVLLANLQLAALLPFFFWRFVRDFPRRPGPYGRQRLATASANAALIVGGLLLFANLLLPPFLPRHSAVAALHSMFDRHRLDSAYWPVLFLFVFPALPYIFWKARQASPDERRRVGILLAGITGGIAPVLLLTLAESVSPRLVAFDLTPAGRTMVRILVHPPLLSVPFTTAYAIVVHHALDVRLIIRRALQYALARSTLVLLSALPFAALLWLIYEGRQRSLVSAWSGGGGWFLLAVLALALLARMFRPRLLDGLDRRFFREQYDARAILGSLVERSRMVNNPYEMAALVPAEIDRALHVQSASLLLLDPVAGVLATPIQTVRPLSASSMLARRLEGADEILDTDWTRSIAWMQELPIGEQEWLTEADARLLVAVRGRTGNLIGALVLGEKRSDVPFSHEDRLLLGTIAHAVALTVENTVTKSRTSADSSREPQTPAAECPVCGLIGTAETIRCARCGGTPVPSSVPSLLAAKFQPVERIGRGGMGVVYRARDVTLKRDVALKTLPRTSPAAAARMRREARAMAAVSHPNLAAIYAVESWRGTPMLIVELVRGGTLADRLRQGPLPLREALELCAAIADALTALHHAGIMHRDIKPSNIGFAEDGTLKLLDFGLAWMLEGALPLDYASGRQHVSGQGDTHTPGLTGTGEIAGTLPYISPETAKGGLPTIAVDLWALTMVLYEAIAGQNPFMENTQFQIIVRISAADVPDIRELAPNVPEPVVRFLRSSLNADRAKRPASAREWKARLSEAAAALPASLRTGLTAEIANP